MYTYMRASRNNAILFLLSNNIHFRGSKGTYIIYFWNQESKKNRQRKWQHYVTLQMVRLIWTCSARLNVLVNTCGVLLIALASFAISHIIMSPTPVSSRWLQNKYCFYLLTIDGTRMRTCCNRSEAIRYSRTRYCQKCTCSVRVS